MGPEGVGRLGAHPRFELRRKLGAGACGSVFEAFDRERGATVALKTLERAEPDQLYRFKHEFRGLAGVVHPRLVTLYELVSHDGVWFFTMELVRGTDFLSYVRGSHERQPEPLARLARPTSDTSPEAETTDLPAQRHAASTPLDGAGLERLCDAMSQLADGVRALHRAGRIHRDLKPSNVRVRPDGGVVVLDFGLVKSLRPGAANETLAIAGTPGYMAPEQTTAGPLGEAADWYALGVMLFQALVGHLPHGTGAEAMLRKQQAEPVAPGSLVSGVPPELDALCLALLQRDPDARPDGEEVVARLRALAPTLPAPIAEVEETAPFVGRQRELQTLLDAYEATADGNPRIVWVHGPSGIGKTTLVQRLLEEIRRRAPDAVVLEGKCYQQESVPYKGLDSAVDALARFLAGLPANEVLAYVPRHVGALTRLFPVMSSVDALHRAPERSSPAEGVELRRRAFGALREMLGRIGARRPLVCCIDDVQWGDDDSGVLLSELLQPPDAPALLVVATFRSDEASHSPLLLRVNRELGELDDRVATIEIGELAPDESRMLVSAVAADALDTGRIERIVLEGQGSPMFLNELTRHMAKSGASGPAESLDDVVQDRVRRLPQAARALLEVISIAGFPTRADTAAAAAGIAPGDAQQQIALLRAEHLLRARVHSGRELIEPYHDRIREAVRDTLDEASQRQCHRALARALERWGARYAEQLAHHLLAAGDEASAAVYARRGAERALSSLAFDRAARLYGIAVDCLDVTTRDGQELLISFAEACSNAGRGKQAGEAYLRASSLTTGETALRLRRMAAEQLMLSGHVADGLEAIRDVLHVYGFRLPNNQGASIAALVWNTARIGLRARRVRLRPASAIEPALLERIDTCWTVAHGTAGVTPVLSAAFAARSAKLALAAGEPTRVAVTLTMHAALRAALSGRYPTALLAIARRAAEASDDPYARGFAQGMGGAALYMCGSFTSALRELTAAETVFRDECRGVAWEIASMHLLAAFSRALLGRWAEASLLVPAQIREAEHRGDLFGAASLSMSTGWIPLLSTDQPDQLEREIDDYARRWGATQMHYQHFFEALSRFYLALYRGDARGAWNTLGQRKQQLRKAGHFRVHVTHTLWLWYEAIACLTIAADLDEGSRDTWLRTVTANARRLRRLGGSFPTNSAETLDALAAVWRHQPGAIERLAVAEEGLVQDGRLLTVAGLRRCRGLIVGGDEGRSLIADADRKMRAEGIRDPVRVGAVMGSRPPRELR